VHRGLVGRQVAANAWSALTVCCDRLRSEQEVSSL
jgi:hypothetical protein